MYLEIKEFNIVIDVSKILYFKKDENILFIAFNFYDIDNNFVKLRFDFIETCEYYYRKIKELLKAA